MEVPRHDLIDFWVPRQEREYRNSSVELIKSPSQMMDEQGGKIHHEKIK